MEVTTETKAKPRAVKGKQESKDTVLTNFELDILNNVFNTRSSGGYGIKDLRLIERVIKTIREAQPTNRPVQPANPPANPTPEQQAEYQKALDAHAEKVAKFMDLTTEIDFDMAAKMIIRHKLSTFKQFSDQDYVRQTILSLADKFGVQE